MVEIKRGEKGPKKKGGEFFDGVISYDHMGAYV